MSVTNDEAVKPATKATQKGKLFLVVSTVQYVFLALDEDDVKKTAKDYLQGGDHRLAAIQPITSPAHVPEFWMDRNPVESFGVRPIRTAQNCAQIMGINRDGKQTKKTDRSTTAAREPVGAEATSAVEPGPQREPEEEAAQPAMATDGKKNGKGKAKAGKAGGKDAAKRRTTGKKR